ncbi:hypothetical protein QJQ45_021656, partial [Haematococcus lacustris]
MRGIDAAVLAESRAFRLLIRHGRRSALRELAVLPEANDWPDEELLHVVKMLLRYGADLCEDSECNTLNWAQARFARALSSCSDLTNIAKLVACIVHARHSPPPSPDSSQWWGANPVADAKAVIRHILLHYPRGQQLKIASYHQDCATAMLAVAAGCGPSARDTVHSCLALGACVEGLVVRRSRRSQRDPAAPPPVEAAASGDRYLVELLLE